jgi:hypothetical protein
LSRRLTEGRVLGIDPGGTTGVAEIEYGKLSARVFTFTDTTFGHQLETYLTSELAWSTPELIVVVEQAPTLERMDADRTREVEDIIVQRFLTDQVKWVRPSDWKRSPHARSAPVPARVSVHEADAVRLAHHWMMVNRKRTA